MIIFVKCYINYNIWLIAVHEKGGWLKLNKLGSLEPHRSLSLLKLVLLKRFLSMVLSVSDISGLRYTCRKLSLFESCLNIKAGS